MLDFYGFAGRYCKHMLENGHAFDSYDIARAWGDYLLTPTNWSNLPDMEDYV